MSYYYGTVWLHERELQEVYRDLDADDPHWRWPDLVAQIPKPPPDDRNSALQVAKVGALLKRANFPRPKNATEHRNARLQEVEAKSLRDAFSRLGPTVLMEARKLAQMPEEAISIEAWENPAEEATGPHVDLGMVSLISVLRQDARLRAHEGNFEGAAESCLALLHATHSINDYPALMASMIRTLGQESAIDAVERLLGNGNVSEKRLHQLQTALTAETKINGLYHALRGEQAFAHQMIVLMKAGKMPYPVAAPNSPLPDWLSKHFPGLWLRGYAQELRLLNEDVKVSKLDDDAHIEKMRTAEQNVSSQILRFAMPKAFDDRQRRKRCCTAHHRGRRRAVSPSVGPDKIDDGGQIRRDASRIRAGDIGFELWLPKFRGIPAAGVEEKK